MPNLLINDVMDELKDQNTRLLNDLEKCHKLNELLLKYRISLINYLNVCKCIQSEERSVVQELEKEYIKLDSQRNDSNNTRVITETNNEINERIETNLNSV